MTDQKTAVVVTVGAKNESLGALKLARYLTRNGYTVSERTRRTRRQDAIERLQKLHDQAMQLCDLGDRAQAPDRRRRFFRLAFQLEMSAARSWPIQQGFSQAVLYRSAAAIAVDAELYHTARSVVRAALDFLRPDAKTKEELNAVLATIPPE